MEAKVANAFSAATFCAAVANVESIGENIELSFKEIRGEIAFLGGCRYDIANGGRGCYCVCGSVKVV